MAKIPWALRVSGHRAAPERIFLKSLQPFFAIYGTGIVGTFAWLFFTLSGASACASGTQTCRIVVSLTGQIALAWLAYWGGRISGNDAMTSVVPIEVMAIVVLVTFVAMLLAQAYALIDRKEQGTAAERKQLETACNEPLVKTSEPNRREHANFLQRRRRSGT